MSEVKFIRRWERGVGTHQKGEIIFKSLLILEKLRPVWWDRLLEELGLVLEPFIGGGFLD